MRLFLASSDFGNHVDRLKKMVGNNHKVLVVSNARDYKSKEERDAVIEYKKKLFMENGFEFVELDLRDYFGKEKELRKFVDEQKAGLVALMGGNTFMLRRALSQSGFDKILKDDLSKDKYMLTGDSAGAIVATPSLRGYERMDKENVLAPKYQKEVIWDGLGLTDVRVIPHADSPKYDKQVIEIREKLFDKNGWDYVVLNDSDVYVIDGEKKEVLR